MRPIFTLSVYTSVLALALWAGAAQAQTPTPETLKQSFEGYWENTHNIPPGRFEELEQPLTPEYQAKKTAIRRNRAESVEIESGDNRCIPSGMPRTMIFGALEIFARDTSLGILTTGGGVQLRNIWLDGRPHTPEADLFDSFGGESIGHWEGDTLVVDTTGLRSDNEFIYGVKAHKMTITERFRKTGPDTLNVVMTVNDPVVFITPWVLNTTYKRAPGRAIDEWSYCVAAFYRGVNPDGSAGFNLTPPAEEPKAGGR